MRRNGYRWLQTSTTMVITWCLILCAGPANGGSATTDSRWMDISLGTSPQRGAGTVADFPPGFSGDPSARKSKRQLYGNNPFVRPEQDADTVIVQLWADQASGDYKRHVNSNALRVILRKSLEHWWYRERHSKFELELNGVLVSQAPSRRATNSLQRSYHYWLNVSDDKAALNLEIEF